MKNNIKFIVLYYKCFRGKQIKNKMLNTLYKSRVYIYYIILRLYRKYSTFKIMFKGE